MTSLFLCGDVMLGRGIDQTLPRSCLPTLHEPGATSALDYLELAERVHGPIARPRAFGDVWGDALELLASEAPDARIVNLETSVTTSETPEPKRVNYRMHPGNVPALTAAGIDCCALANNHVRDWGTAGLLETLDTLARAGIAVAGAGRDVASARAPAVLATSGPGRVLVFAFGTTDSGIPREWAAGTTSPGVHLLEDPGPEALAAIARLVHSAKQTGDLAVASVHWGPNWGYEVPRSRRRFAHGLIEEAGIDVVHGHSSHHPMGIEVHRARPILYGCGDFLNDYEGISGYEEYRGDLVLMYFPSFEAGNGRLIRLRMRPLQIRNFSLRRPSVADLSWLHARLDRECRRFGRGLRPDAEGFVLEP